MVALQTYPPLEPKVVLAIAAHPDDLDFLDFGSTGTLASFAEAGAAVYYLIVTDGSKGSSDLHMLPAKLTQIRRREQQAALAAIGGKEVIFLDYPDAELELNLQLKKDLVRIIRELKPDVVVTLDPSFLYSATYGCINHPDHRIVGQATLDAVYPLARDHLSFPDLVAAGYQPHQVKTVLLANFNHGDFSVDISATLPKKLAAVAAHQSQSHRIDRFAHTIQQFAEACGKSCGCKYAECFVRIDVRAD